MTREELTSSYDRVRGLTHTLCEPLETEDYVVQSADDVSPPKWNIAHTTWFFETFLLSDFVRGYSPYRAEYPYLFNSYYVSMGERWGRSSRGVLSRPTVKEVFSYRAAIDERMRDLMRTVSESDWGRVAELIVLGLHHEQQHQELLMTDVKYNFAINPLRPAYVDGAEPLRARAAAGGSAPWIDFEGGVVEIGHQGDGFGWDNEFPRHKQFLRDFRLQGRLVTNGEFLAFIEDGGYADHRHWLSDGWDLLQRERWGAPLYWEQTDGEWMIMSLRGLRRLDPDEPLAHVSFYEADAYASWAGLRLATEVEWEHAARVSGADPANGNLLDPAALHPRAADGDRADGGMTQLFGDVWEWTSSSYLPYPGYRRSRDALGEYNGKFMSNQMVLRGGSCVTPPGHIRATYRNFFQCDKRWQFTGIRLASDARKGKEKS